MTAAASARDGFPIASFHRGAALNQTRTLSLALAMRVQFAIYAARDGKLNAAADIHAWRAKRGALLVEPLHEPPYVVVGDYDTAGNARFDRYLSHVFLPLGRASGVLWRRARIAADLFFDPLREVRP